jgi:CheY-like chemotaxis protein/HPt (histidine-containing phosphotransfer) domain-containing protein
MPQVIDHTRLRAIARGGAAAQAEIVAEFRRTNDEDAAALREAVRLSDYAQVGVLAHRIEGASMMIGAMRYAQTCAPIAHAAAACDTAAVERAMRLFESEMGALNAYLASPDAAAWTDDGEPLLLCSGLKFLVVEDHVFQRDLVMRFLLRHGAAQARGVGEGGAAMMALAAEPADIMLLDLSLPGMDGMDLLRALSGAACTISVIVMSALHPSLMGSVVQLAAGLRVDLLGTISKPPTEKNLAPLIARYWSSRTEGGGQQAATALQ